MSELSVWKDGMPEYQAAELSPAQKDVLRLVATLGDGSGWSELELQYECKRVSEGCPPCLVSSLLARVIRALERRRLVVREDDGPRLTPEGKDVLACLAELE